MKKNRKMILLAIAIILTVGIFFLVTYLKSVRIYTNKIETLAISNVEIKSISDGKYMGEYDVDFIYAKVMVEVKDGKIISIDLIEHKNDRGSSAEQIVSSIVQEQNIDVDAVSGATNSSKVIQKAVENALMSNSLEIEN